MSTLSTDVIRRLRRRWSALPRDRRMDPIPVDWAEEAVTDLARRHLRASAAIEAMTDEEFSAWHRSLLKAI